MDEFNTIPVRDPIKVLISCGTAHNVSDTIVDGKLLMKDKKLIIMDEEKVKREAWSAAHAVGGRAPRLNELSPFSLPMF